VEKLQVNRKETSGEYYLQIEPQQQQEEKNNKTTTTRTFHSGKLAKQT